MMVTQIKQRMQQITRLKSDLQKKQNKIDELQKIRGLTIERENLIKRLRTVQNPRAFLRREQTKKTIKKVGSLSWKGAKKTWDFLGRMAEEDQRAGRSRKRRK